MPIVRYKRPLIDILLGCPKEEYEKGPYWPEDHPSYGAYGPGQNTVNTPIKKDDNSGSGNF